MLQPSPRRYVTARTARPASRGLGRRGRTYRGGGGVALAVLVSNTLGTAPSPAGAIELGGEAAVTSDAIYHGVSESSGRPAVQTDVHATTSNGTFLGAFAVGALSTPGERARRPGAAAELGLYAGQRVALGSAWTVQLSAYNHHFFDREQDIPADYQEFEAQLSYLDLWSFSLTAIPDAPRPVPGPQLYDGKAAAQASVHGGHYPAWVAATQLQWVLTPRLFLTAGAGYYFVQDDACVYGSECSSAFYATGRAPVPPRGYVFGAAGLAYQWTHWRIDVDYFLTDDRAAAQLYPFPAARQRVTGTLSWRF